MLLDHTVASLTMRSGDEPNGNVLYVVKDSKTYQECKADGIVGAPSCIVCDRITFVSEGDGIAWFEVEQGEDVVGVPWHNVVACTN